MNRIRVAVRVRPFNSKERNENAQCIISTENNCITITDVQNVDSKIFAYDRIYWSGDKSNGDPCADNKIIFQGLGREILSHIYSGYNSMVFAYGQTGSGKSYTLGSQAENGLIQMCILDMLRQKKEKAQEGIQVSMKLMCVQIYNDKIRDLINPQADLKILQAGTAVILQGAALIQYNSMEEIQYLLKQIKKSKRIGLNSTKSQSNCHTIFTLNYHQSGMGKMTRSELKIADLAGSQKRAKTNSPGIIRENNSALRSLTNFNLVIEALARNSLHKQNNLIPYRNSMLTHLLSESLNGNSKTFMIGTISPAHTQYDESLRTLRMAHRCSQIVENSKGSVEMKDIYKEQLTRQVIRLRNELEKAKGKQVYIHSVQFIAVEVQEKIEKQCLKQEEELVNRIAIFQGQLDRNSREERKYVLEEVEEVVQQQTPKAKKSITNDGTCMKGDIDEAVPYIMNISRDPSRLRFQNLKQGENTVGSHPDNTIKMNAIGIKPKHCSMYLLKGQVFVHPYFQSKVSVNSSTINQSVKLSHLDILTFGYGNIFKLVMPLPRENNFHFVDTVYGPFLDAKMKGPEREQLKQFFTSFEKLPKQKYMQLIQQYGELAEQLDQANGYTSERYRRNPLRRNNIFLKINAVINPQSANKSVPHLLVIAEHKITKELQFVWSRQTFQRRLSAMQQWWKCSKSNTNYSSSLKEDPWFDANDRYAEQKEKLQAMEGTELIDYWNQQISCEILMQRELEQEQKQILNKISKQGYSEAAISLYANHYFGEQTNQTLTPQLQKIREDSDTHRNIIRFMECCAEIQQCQTKQAHQIAKRQKRTSSVGHDKCSNEIKVLLQRVEDLTEELRKRTKEKKRS